MAASASSRSSAVARSCSRSAASSCSAPSNAAVDDSSLRTSFRARLASPRASSAAAHASSRRRPRSACSCRRHSSMIAPASASGSEASSVASTSLRSRSNRALPVPGTEPPTATVSPRSRSILVARNACTHSRNTTVGVGTHWPSTRAIPRSHRGTATAQPQPHHASTPTNPINLNPNLITVAVSQPAPSMQRPARHRGTSRRRMDPIGGLRDSGRQRRPARA